MARFKTYNASAGAGKTYSLVLEFLTFCLAVDDKTRFRQILAITFTNKAATEMKARIINTLEEFANYEDHQDVPSMLSTLSENTGATPMQLKFRAKNVLREILHNYSALSVSTIDKFTNRLIRSFAQDLNLSSNYEVELDSKAMLAEAIDRFLSDVKENEVSAEILIEFIERQLDEGKSPRIENNLADIGESLFQESAFDALKKLRSFSGPDFLKARKELFDQKAEIEKQLRQLQQKFIETSKAAGLTSADFTSYMSNWLFNKLGDASNCQPAKTPYNILKGSATFYRKADAGKFTACEEDLTSQLAEIIQFIETNIPDYDLLDLILKDVYGLAVLNEISQHLQDIKQEENRLPIGEFNQLISERLSSEPAEYLFEKIGERYVYFFIDEFQDTSVLQWQNLLPLINNAMAGGGRSMIVGDGKQSIYRWRGGEVQQFVDLASDLDTSNKLSINGKLTELYPREVVPLEFNFRSRKTVVDFNNRFFASNGTALQDEAYKRLYTEGSYQEPVNKSEGYVSLRLIETSAGEDDEYQQKQFKAIEEIIHSRLKNGFRKNDICILTRSNKRGAQISKHLISKGIDIISPDSLFIADNREVGLLISLMQMLVRPDVEEYRLPLLRFLFDQQNSISDKHEYLYQHLKAPVSAVWNEIISTFPTFDSERVSKSSLQSLAHYAVRTFGLNDQRNPFLQSFLDQVHNYQQNEGSDVAGFLRWWDSTGSSKSLSLPEEADAVKVMTIHKSKGLEFPVTILAFADWRATTDNKAYEWIDLDENKGSLPVARVKLKNSSLPDSDTPYNRSKKANDQKILLDNLNLLYVAQTRAVDELHIISASGRHNEGITVCKYYQEFLEDDATNFSIGSPVIVKQAPAPEAERLALFISADWQSKLKISLTAPLNWESAGNANASFGKLVHSILAEVKVADEYKEVLRNYLDSGKISHEEFQKADTYVSQLFDNEDLLKYFQDGLDILNESEVLLPGGQSLRPDRVVLEDDKVHIIDYKTGLQSAKHNKQVEEYRHQLSEMGYPEGDNVIIYLGEKTDYEKWESQKA